MPLLSTSLLRVEEEKKRFNSLFETQSIYLFSFSTSYLFQHSSTFSSHSHSIGLLLCILLWIEWKWRSENCHTHTHEKSLSMIWTVRCVLTAFVLRICGVCFIPCMKWWKPQRLCTIHFQRNNLKDQHDREWSWRCEYITELIFV